MLDLLSPLRGYIAQNLQFYLSKYIEDIQLEGLGLFGGDLVLNDLEIKRHVLRESLEIPSSFDFSRGFIRELRIHIPWTQLLSQPIEVKLYTIELILTAKSDDPARAGAAAAAGGDANAEPPPEDKIEQPKSGWIHDTLQKILANISVQVNNLVLKYEHDDVVFSIALGTLDFYSASESDGWKRNFEELGGGRRAICKRIDAKDVTIFLDRYTSEADAKDGSTRDRVRRNVVGYELPVLSRTSASVRAKLQLFPNAAAGRAQDGRRSRPTSPRSPLHQPPPTPSGVQDEGNIVDVDGLFGYRPSVMCDPFYYYSCNPSSVTPMHEVDIFIGELLFSVSDRQLEMLNQLIKSASSKIEQAHELAPQEKNTHVASGRDVKAAPDGVATAAIPRKYPNECQKMDGIAKKRESWFGWAMNALGTAEDEEEDELVSELLAETRGALLRVRPPISDADEDALIASGPVTKTSCVRLCISSASLTLRKHEKEDQEVERQDAVVAENEEEFVPVANIGMVKVSRQTRRRKVARPAVPVLNLTMSYVALEMLLARGEEKSGTDLVFEIEKVELVSATASENREDSKCKKGRVLLAWGSIDSSHFSDCVSHPYFINSFFGEETTRLNQRETRSFEIVKVSLDADIPVWKTLEVGQGNSDESKNDPCECYTTWNGKAGRCIPIGKVSDICEQAIRIIGIKERVLDGGILSNAVSTSWASNNFPVSISEGMLRALTSIADEYRAHRSPDLGAQHNLTQLLQPQLHALFSRYTMHSCSAASLRASMRSGNVRHRSVHSALRLRLASTLTRVDRDELSANIDVRKETISKVLDISFGEAQAVLDPPKCVEILEAVSIILQTNKEGDQESENEVSVATTENASPSIQYIVQSDSKLVTASKVHILVNDALQLKIPSVSISSLDTEPNPPKQVQPRGTLKLECRMENARLCVSENGVLKGLLDPMLFGIGVVSISVDLSHHTGDHEQAYAIDMSVHVSNIQVSLSRLKLLYLFKLPFLETETWLISSPVRSSSSIPQSEAENNASLRYRWHLRIADRFGQL
ncbi:hypothetical protein PF005_g3995 [Phytophthora fragariae]|uniref:Uncharacterized protein n=1 Tax=Phytophthora fragariae TaxID=53985 RepID=A0A6A3Z4H5_9STRA|nr:hypothetical protein PF007_g4186 [Phytophthora fragariae]KAE9229151.1 hypothetical protein PF005_g3995 [Phytophthora fragariae]